MSAFLRKVRRAPKIHRPEPPNFEIGWKRTKKINMEKPNGWMIMDFSEKRRGIDGTAALRFGGAAGEGGGDRGRAAREEEEVQLAGGEVEERLATELYRVLKLMEMDLDMVKAASNAWTGPKPAAASPF